MTRSPCSPASEVTWRHWSNLTILALGMFVLGTGEFAVVGMAVPIAAFLQVDAVQVGYLNSAFAAAMVVGAPLSALVCRRLRDVQCIIAAAVSYAVINLATALSDTLAILMLLRIMAGLATSFYCVTVLSYVVTSTPQQFRGRAMALLLSGFTVSNVIGVPMASLVSVVASWQTVFVSLGLLSIAVAVLAGCLVQWSDRQPPSTAAAGRRLTRELRSMATRPILLILTVSVLFQASVFGVFSYITVLLTDVTGLTGEVIAAELFAYGVGTAVGLVIGGWASDRAPWAALVAGIACATICMIALGFALPTPVVALPLLVVQGLVVFFAAAPINERVVTMAAEAPTLAAGANTAALNTGNTLGPFIIGIVLTSGIPLPWVPIIGACGLFAATLVCVYAWRTSVGAQ